MLLIKNVPIVIELGIGAIEVEFAVVEKRRRPRVFPSQLLRLELNATVAEELPFIPSAKVPHVFSLAEDIRQSLFLVIYDHLGRISFVFSREDVDKPWDKQDVTAEHAGKTVTQFSVRFAFPSAKVRDKFLAVIDDAIALHNTGQDLPPKMSATIVSLLNRLRTPPVVLPAAHLKTDLKRVNL